MADLIAPVPSYAREGIRAYSVFDRVSQGVPGYLELKAQGIVRSGMIRDFSTGENIYSHFAFVFADAFPNVSVRQLRRVSVAALFLLNHVLLADDLTDEGELRCRPAVSIVANAFQALGWRLLSKAAGSRSLPWTQVASCYREYLVAVYLECRDHRAVPQPYSEADLLEVVSRRCAVAKIVTATLCTLGDRPDLVTPLAQSLDDYWVVDCLLDDWKDWKTDLAHERYTYLLTSAIEGTGGFSSFQSLAGAARIEKVARFIYGSGFLAGYIDRMTAFLESSRSHAVRAGCARWCAVLDERLVFLSAKRSHLLRESRALTLEHDSYRYELRPSRIESVDDELPNAASECPGSIRCAPDLLEAARRSVRFLLRRYQEKGRFADFITPHGELARFTSAYVGCALQKWEGIDTTAQHGANSDLPRILAGVAESMAPFFGDSGCSANANLPCDAETTAWAIRFFSSRGEAEEPVCCERLSQYQNSDGGFARFSAQAAGLEFAGWAVSQPDVTGVALGTIVAASDRRMDRAIQRASDYLLQNLDGLPLWRSYWWEGSAYASLHCLDALSAAGVSLSASRAGEMWEEVLGCQDERGSWGDALRGRSTAFETACTIRLLLRLRRGAEGSQAILRGMIWLVLNQLADGSWSPEPVLRIPLGSDREPWKYDDWKLDAPLTYGSLVRDHRALFTTSSVLMAITEFIQCAGDYRLAVLPRTGQDCRVAAPSAFPDHAR